MMRTLCLTIVLGAATGGLSQPIAPSPRAEAQAAPVEQHRSPLDIALIGEQHVLTANHTADSVTLVNWQSGSVLAEVRVGRKPVAIAATSDGKRAAVSNLWSGSITLLDVSPDSLKVAGNITVGPLPRGLIFSKDGSLLYAACAGRDEIVEIECRSKEIGRRWPAPREPQQLVVSADGRWLVAASNRSAQVRCWDLHSGKQRWERVIFDGFNLRGLSFAADGRHVLCAHQIRRDFPVSRKNIEEGWVIDNRLSRFVVEDRDEPFSWQIALDIRGLGAADPEDLASACNGKTVAVAVGGTHELLLLENEAIPWTPGDPGDFLDSELEKGSRLRRLTLGGRPVALAAPTNEPTKLLVANLLLDAVQVVDAVGAKVIRTIPLGGPKTPTPARTGEAIFYDAARSHNQWFSCHSCHVDGHTCGLPFDTLNDDSYGNPKMTLSLRNVSKTGPWTWHGWQKDLGAAVSKSLTKTMCGANPSDADIAAVLAYLETLTPPPNPNRLSDGSPTPAAKRGELLFRGKARCVRCHHGDYFTSPRVYDVKLDSAGSPFQGFNPPSLLGLYDRGPFLHDGRAITLEQLLERDHGPAQLGGQELTPQERRDLCEFLQSL